MSYKIYLSASTQEHNKGVAGFGTEEDNMFVLRNKVIIFLNRGGYKFKIGYNSNKADSLQTIVKNSNNFAPVLHLAFHTNAGNKKARGCEVFYSMYNRNGTGKRLATLWYNRISPITPSVDRGVKSDSLLYSNGLFELRETTAVSALCEFIFHTNTDDVNFFKKNIANLALETARAIYDYFGIKYERTQKYIVQAGVFESKENARKLQERLKKAGFDAIIK